LPVQFPGQATTIHPGELNLYFGEIGGQHPLIEVDRQSLLDDLRDRSLPTAEARIK
jgi:hypothetical protein